MSNKKMIEVKPMVLTFNQADSDLLLKTLTSNLGANHPITKTVSAKVTWHRNQKSKKNDSVGDFGESEKYTNFYRKSSKGKK